MTLNLTAIIVAACLVVLVLLFLLIYRSRKKGGYVVIGEQLAKASQAEERRKAKGEAGQSPMPDKEYDFWRDELSLINPVQNPLDSIISELCQRFARSGAPTQANMRASISMEEFYTLLTFSRRAAVFAIREQNADWVVSGLTAVSMIERERTDFRDILLALSLLYHSASRIGGDADQLFRDAAVISVDEVSELILGFIKRPSKERDIRSSWGYDEIETENGIGFIGWDFKQYDPTYDLKIIAIDVADLIATDKYQPSSISIAGDLPRVWLQSVDDALLDQALKAVRAGASVSARLRPNEHPEHESQMFTVFLLEMANESAPQRLLELSQKKRTSDYHMLGLAEGRLFCLVVARSYVMGAEAFETSESLSRFSKGIAEILKRYM